MKAAFNFWLIAPMLFQAFLFYPCYPCFCGALIFRKNKDGIAWVIFTRVTTITSWALQHVGLQKELNIHEIFHLLNKKIQKKNSRDLSLKPNKSLWQARKQRQKSSHDFLPVKRTFSVSFEKNYAFTSRKYVVEQGMNVSNFLEIFQN